MISLHIDLMTAEYGEYGIRLMRKHIASYIHGFRNSAKIRQEIMHHDSKRGIMESLKELA